MQKKDLSPSHARSLDTLPKTLPKIFPDDLPGDPPGDLPNVLAKASVIAMPSLGSTGSSVSPHLPVLPPLPSGLLSNMRLPPAIMVLGTASHVGKSLLTAGLCRLFTRRGLSVAPFKAQNMALNSAVTPDGGEIGRAQALQAQACRLLPDVRMNPVLLKPQSETGSQVVVLGHAQGHAHAREYESMKPALFHRVCQAYADLAREHDLIILEGAGSPAEINLKARDISNTRMAREARARAILVGDIDRGGVFAAFVGTLALLEPWERALVSGLVINKFRGDASLLPPALNAISAHTGTPFLGVLPWLANLGLPEEDSLGLRHGGKIPRGSQPKAPVDVFDVAVVDLPFVGNIVDIDPLLSEPHLRTRMVSKAEDLGTPDLIILPGSKSTVADWRSIRSSGLIQAVERMVFSPEGPDLLGICGGLQMLGRRIDDPPGLEEESGHREECLGALPLITRMDEHKILRRAVYHDDLLGMPLQGYEIHHGRTHIDTAENACCQKADSPFRLAQASSQKPLHIWMKDSQGHVLGWMLEHAAGSRVWGTYTHGLFDDDAWRTAFLNTMRVRRGKSPRALSCYSVEPGLDRLADTLEEHLDIDSLWKK